MNKLEAHIKKTLHGREIHPRKGAWDRIEAGLDEREKPNRRWNTFLAAAAGLAVLFVLGLLFKNGQSAGESTRAVVDRGIEAPAPNTQPVETGANTTVIEEKQSPARLKPTEDQIADFASQSNLKETQPGGTELAKAQELPFDRPEWKQVIDRKLMALMVQVEALEDEKNIVSEAEIDSLLMAAEQEILAKRLESDTEGVDALALLSEVEEELDRSFREQLFDRLKDGFYELRLAMANRNP